MLKFDNKIESVLAEYHKRIEEEDALAQSLSHEERNERLNEFLLPVGEEVGIFINSLAKSAKSQTILEIGTSYGYSTIWLAEAAKATGGKVISLEISAEKASFAQQKLEEAGLSEFVEFRVGDALETIEKATETFDFVLVDVWKELYLPCFDLFFSKLKKGAWVLADNMIFPPHSLPEATAYRNRVRETNAFDTVLMPIGSGIEVSFLK
jgi:predicted O-methyltransferase YrrM